MNFHKNRSKFIPQIHVTVYQHSLRDIGGTSIFNTATKTLELASGYYLLLDFLVFEASGFCPDEDLFVLVPVLAILVPLFLPTDCRGKSEDSVRLSVCPIENSASIVGSCDDT